MKDVFCLWENWLPTNICRSSPFCKISTCSQSNPQRLKQSDMEFVVPFITKHRTSYRCAFTHTPEGRGHRHTFIVRNPPFHKQACLEVFITADFLPDAILGTCSHLMIFIFSLPSRTIMEFVISNFGFGLRTSSCKYRNVVVPYNLKSHGRSRYTCRKLLYDA